MTAKSAEVIGAPLVDADPAKPEVLRSAPLFSLEQLYIDHARAVARWVVLIGGRGLDTEDLMQEVFIVAAQQQDKFRGEAKPSTWLFQITWRLVQNARRKAKWRRFLPWTAELDDNTPGDRPGPFESLEQRERMQDVQKLLEGLREEHRAALLLFELEGKNLDELAEMFGVHRNTIAVWIHRARGKVLGTAQKKGEK